MKASAARFIGSLPVPLPLLTLPCLAQDIEPRRWSHLPIGANFGRAAYAFSTGDITFNPVLQIQDGQFDLNTAAVQYIHSFELLGKSARFDLTQAYHLLHLPPRPMTNRQHRLRPRRRIQRQQRPCQRPERQLRLGPQPRHPNQPRDGL